jgi:multidrug efflux pump subunit AcrA (membrane-fusion protein)
MNNPVHLSGPRKMYQQHRLVFLAIQAVVFVILGYLLARGFGGSSAAPESGKEKSAGAADAEAGPSMWTCSMHPNIRQTSPGDCPICGMDLIPVAKTSGGLRSLTVSPETRALMNIASSAVERKYVAHQIPMVGMVDYDETKFGYITAWIAGRLDRLYVDYPGVSVNEGDHMVYIYSPELYSAQVELFLAIKRQSERPETTTRSIPQLDYVESAREKLRLLGLSEEQIKKIEKQDTPSDHLTINAPVSGVVIEKLKQEGDYVKTGERIYTVADLNQVWVHLDAYEADLPWVRYGQDVTISTEAYPGEEFHGRIAFIQPVLNDKTRTVKVRVNVPNPNGKLKPEMFVHGVVRPQVAAGGRVMDPSLAGKWISPMHPEIVKDEPGVCDICGMPLVRAESLGFVTPDIDDRQAPLVIPYSAALVTGRRAIVYVELPVMPRGVETAFQGIGAALKKGDLEVIRKTFSVFNSVLDHPYDQPATDYARQLWNGYADRLAEYVLPGKRASSKSEAEDAYTELERIMLEVREDFGPIGQPAFEGREIVLGPRAGNYYLVRNGLQAGELVVTQGNFKIDAEIQIQAKPSMMTPEGGGGGGHHHGGGMEQKPGSADEHEKHKMSLPTAFRDQLRSLQSDYERVAEAVEQKDLGKITAAFAQFGETLSRVDGSELTGHPRMLWKEFQMLLSNDAVEGSEVEQLEEADRVYLSLKSHMRRLREQLKIQPDEQQHIEPIDASPEFQNDLAAIWERYLAIQKELASDKFEEARRMLTSFESSVAELDDSTLEGHAAHVWKREHANLDKLIAALKTADEIEVMRARFKPLSEEIGFLAKSFGFGEAGPIYEIHCPMAFEGKGALWYQENDLVRNPYYGASMLKCADRVEKIIRDEPELNEEERDHSQHDHSQD